MIGSRGLIWKSEDGEEGSYKNAEQKSLAAPGKPAWDSSDLCTIIRELKPDVLVGAAGRVLISV